MASSAGERLRYRFVSNDGSTRWFETTVNGWTEGAPELRQVGTARVVTRQ